MVFYTYILASDRNGSLHLGSTHVAVEAIAQHHARRAVNAEDGVGCGRLVWFQAHESREAAVQQERRMKAWKRAWTLRAIDSENPEWIDLAERLAEP